MEETKGIITNLNATGEGKAVNVSETGKRIEIDNGLLTVSLSLSAEPGPLVPEGCDRWYAGSANSIRFCDDEYNQIEMLDFNQHYLSAFEWRGHDPEKRCLQIDRLTLFDSQLGTEVSAQVGVFNRNYEKRDIVHEDNRCSIFVQSALVCPELAHIPSKQAFSGYYLQRKLTFEERASHVFDEIFVVRAGEHGFASAETAEKIDFSAGFFMLLDCGLTPALMRDLSNGRFTTALTGGNRWAPRFAYGYACSSGTAITNLNTPVPGFPYPDKAHKTFAWQTSSCRNLRMVHLFTFGDSIDTDGSLLKTLQP